jgi:trans-aconitate methyltransferase
LIRNLDHPLKARRQTQSVVWNPHDYAANSAAQLAWARELIAKLRLRGDERLLDVGSGDGKITAELARALPRGSIVGLDGSPEMLRFAREHFPAGQFPNLEFVRMDARAIRFDRLFDVVFSNATLHWVDDHPAFLRGAAACLKPGGRLVISCGGKGNAQEVFVALRATLRTKRWRAFFRNLAAPYFFHRPEDYEKWLPRSGFKPTLVRLANKDVHYPGRDGLRAWLRTTWLPYTQQVLAAEREEFIADVADRFLVRHPPDGNGELVIRMVRLEIDAIRI